MTRHVLVLEPDARGHAEEWLLHILRLVRDEEPDIEVTLAVPEPLASRLSREARAHRRIHIRPLDGATVTRCMHPNLARMAIGRWRAMRRLLAASNADEGLFLCIDSLSLPLALGLGFGGKPVSGVLFRPSVHYDALGQAQPTRSERLRDWRKRILYPLMLKNSAVKTVHSLDPYFPAYARERYIAGDKVVTLPDPIAGLALGVEGTRVPRFPQGRMAFLLFGEITDRKGALPLLEACSLLDADTARRTAILLAGRVDAAIEDRVRDLVTAAREARPELWIQVDDRRLSFAELAAAVTACDVVLAPYQRFVGSSGVMIWAARTLKPVITQNYGLLGRLVRDFRLGLTVDTSSPDALAHAVRRAVRAGAKSLSSSSRAREFLAERDGRLFAARLLRVPLHRDSGEALTEARARRARAL